MNEIVRPWNPIRKPLIPLSNKNSKRKSIQLSVRQGEQGEEQAKHNADRHPRVSSKASARPGHPKATRYAKNIKIIPIPPIKYGTKGEDRESTLTHEVESTASDSIDDISREVEKKSDLVGSQEPKSVVSCLPDLIAMARPANLPGVVLFHVLGVHLATKGTSMSLVRLLAAPSMLATLVVLLLISSTSMLVNDYYDFKLGNDSTKKTKPLGNRVPMIVAKRFLSYLYAVSFLCLAMVPGVAARMTASAAYMLTFWYTEHLKPKTWLKNIFCAGLIALSPLTSGVAALAHIGASSVTTASDGGIWSLMRLVALIFFGILGREITMDINDVEDDRRTGVLTVPVVHGRRFASVVSLVCPILAASFAIAGPLMKTMQRPEVTLSRVLMRQWIFALLGSFAQVRRGWEVFQTKGEDSDVASRAVDEGLLSVVLYLISFI